jgi:GH35 family endo-1,4-beta-xylanase
MTPENAFKWFNYEVQPGNTSQAQALLDSRYIAYAQQHRMPMLRGHTLEWLKEEEGARCCCWQHPALQAPARLVSAGAMQP